MFNVMRIGRYFDVIMIMIIKRWNANTIYQPYCLIQSTCMEIQIKSISQL